MRQFGQSLRYGTKHIYQSMSRLLTIWLDLGAQAMQRPEGGKTEERARQAKLLLVKVISQVGVSVNSTI